MDRARFHAYRTGAVVEGDDRTAVRNDPQPCVASERVASMFVIDTIPSTRTKASRSMSTVRPRPSIAKPEYTPDLKQQRVAVGRACDGEVDVGEVRARPAVVIDRSDLTLGQGRGRGAVRESGRLKPGGVVHRASSSLGLTLGREPAHVGRLGPSASQAPAPALPRHSSHAFRSDRIFPDPQHSGLGRSSGGASDRLSRSPITAPVQWRPMAQLISLGTLVGLALIGLVILGGVKYAGREETDRTRRGDAFGKGSGGDDD